MGTVMLRHNMKVGKLTVIFPKAQVHLENVIVWLLEDHTAIAFQEDNLPVFTFDLEQKLKIISQVGDSLILSTF